MRNQHYDICVIGGGPAGISAAIKLQQIGFNTLLIDSGKQPNRPDVQSVRPVVMTLLATLGLNSEQIQSCFTHIQQTRIRWSSITEEINQPSGFLVYRHILDNELIKAAKQSGVHVMQPASVMSCRNINNQWELQVNQMGKYLILKPKFLVDASGKQSGLHGSKIRMGPKTIAITGSWKNLRDQCRSTRLESTAAQWLWGAKIYDDLFHVTVFTDPCDIHGRSELMRDYVTAIGRTKLFKDCLLGSVAGKLATFDVTTYYYENTAGRSYIKVGEAGCGLDPLSSQGIQTAVSNAIQGAIVVNTILSKTDHLDLALEFHRLRKKESIQNHLLMCSKSYSSASCWHDQLFWINRTMNGNQSFRHIQTDDGYWNPEMMIRLSQDVILQSVACIEGDLICSKMGLVHPGLDRPLVYWQNVEIEKLIEPIDGNRKISELIRIWSGMMPFPDAVQLVNTLRHAGVVDIKT